MNYEELKNRANEMLQGNFDEGIYIGYDTSVAYLAEAAKAVCACANNYNDSDRHFIFVGLNGVDNEGFKYGRKPLKGPILPVQGIEENQLEQCKNEILSIRSLLYPEILFDLIISKLENVFYLLIAVPRQNGGPFMVSPQAERDENLKVKAGRYIRVDSQIRLAKVDEEYDLLRKFAGYHFTSSPNQKACFEDLNMDYMREYLRAAESELAAKDPDKIQIAEELGLLDLNDAGEKRVKNFAVLMFANRPDEFIPGSYIEVIIDHFGPRQRTESRIFTGPIWKQYRSLTDFIDANFLSTLILREDGKALHRKISNFPLAAVQELAANAIVHNAYENKKQVQIYISDHQIQITNYNKPLPPLSLQDLNQQSLFNVRNVENPELQDMFKTLGIVRSSGTGIGWAKRVLEENYSPALFYKEFDPAANVSCVVIPVNQEYQRIKGISVPDSTPTGTTSAFDVQQIIRESGYSKPTKKNLLKIYREIGPEVFGNTRIAAILDCSETTATAYLKRLHEDLRIAAPVQGLGKGKYKFIV